MRDFHELDTLRILVTVRDDASDPVDLTSATLAALIGGTAPGSLPGRAGTVTAVDLALGQVMLAFAPESAKPPRATVQLRAMIGAEWQTIYEEEFEVRRSIRAG